MARSGKDAGKQRQLRIKRQQRIKSRLRIIGGQWRGRKLTFTPEEGLRPTSDRVRETLFNWLAPYIHDARCADLFAGSGALGLEALSRGASHCDFVDTSGAALAQIGNHLATLGAASAGHCHPSSALQFLQASSEPYDLVFIDPPFSRELVNPVCTVLAEKKLLVSGGLAYVEWAASEPPPMTPPGWSLHRDKTAGGVAYRLFIVD
jgi:16S rRNA (guanine966-N2)-methyltransferase